MKRILCLGDSNTFGFDPRSYLGSRYPADVRWTELLRRAGWEAVNCGQNGLSIPRPSAFPELARLLARAQPLDGIAVMLGSNDLLQGASAQEAGVRMEALLRWILEQAADTPVVLIAPPPMCAGEWVQSPALIDASLRLTAEYRALAERLGLAFADAGAWDIALTFDGVHFAPEGHAAFARGLGEVLARLPARRP
ncbi:MAG: lipase [Oscillospiraceae bacterium]|nr:lipase [Oscillospiraceae bacterium]